MPEAISLFFSIFTPAYNRADKIHRVWESLQNQTYKNFEWIVVDDGSTDNIQPLLEKYKQLAEFPVIILTQPNSGKHIAWNRAVDIAKGELFVPADSDDAFIPESLALFVKYWQEIPVAERDDYSGINVLCIDSVTKQIVGSEFPGSPFISNNLELEYIHKIQGEKWGCIRTHCLKLRKNPEIIGGYLSENWIWFWLARRFKVRCINIPLRIYFQNEGNNIMSKIDKETHIKRLQTTYAFLSWHLSENIDFIYKYRDLIYVIKNYMFFWKESFYLKLPPGKVINDMKLFWPRFFTILTILPGFAYYLISKFKNK